jgi:hypothetical protein
MCQTSYVVDKLRVILGPRVEYGNFGVQGSVPLTPIFVNMPHHTAWDMFAQRRPNPNGWVICDEKEKRVTLVVQYSTRQKS